MHKGDLYVEKRTGVVYAVRVEPIKMIPEVTWVIMERHKQVTQAPLRYVRFDTFANDYDSLEAWTSRRLLEEEEGGENEQK